MAGGLPDSELLEFEATAGVWTDITVDIDGDAGVEVHFGRDTQSDDGQPSNISFTLKNPVGRYTVDNPTSDLWPNVVEGKRVRYTVTKGGIVSCRGTFYVRRWQLNVVSSVFDSTVTVSGADRMATTNARQFDSDLIERWRNFHPTDGTNFCDIFRLKDTETPQAPNNVGHQADGSDPPSAAIVQNQSGTGDINYVTAEGLIAEGCIEFIPKAATGPVLLCPVQPGSHEFMFWFRTYAAPPPPGSFAVLAEGRDSAGVEIWSIRFIDTGTNYEVHWWINGADLGPIDNAAYFGDWHSIYMLDGGGGVITLYYDSFTGDPRSFAGFGDFSDVATMNIGGRINQQGRWNKNKPPSLFARATRTTNLAVHMWTAFPMAGGQLTFGGFEPFGRAGQTATTSVRFLGNYMQWIGQYPANATITGSDNRVVALKSSQGRNAMDCAQELARTLAATIWVRPTDDKIELLTGDQVRPQAPAFAVYLDADDDITQGQQWSRGTVENPTRQTVTSPGGDATYADTTIELIERRDGGSIDSMWTSPEDAKALAAFYVNRGKKRRLQQFGVDPVTAIGAGLDNGEAATATTGGTTTTLVATNADATDITIGDQVRLYTAAGTLKEDTIFTVTNKVIAASTTITFTPAAAVVTATTDQMRVARPLWEALLVDLRPGTRMQLRPVTAVAGAALANLLGRTTEDVHVLGWTERWMRDSVQFLFDTVPADSPAEITIEDTGDLYDRMDFDEATPVTTTAMTTSSTSVTFNGTGPPLTNSGAEFPLYLTIGGEDLLVSSAPASAVFPQTVTVARAQRGSVAAVHAIGSVVHLTPLAGFAP